MNKYNILYINSHDTGRYVSPYGYAIPTPNIQKLAEEGVLFRQAYCAAPTCSPSRASLLTGEYPHSNGQFGLVNRGFELPDTEKHIANTLKEVGYYSALIGFQHIRKDPYSIGYDYVKYLDDKAEFVVPEAVDFLNNNPQEPFFLNVGLTETHREFYSPDPEDKADYCQPPDPLPDTPETRKDMAAYKASARVLDMGIGDILEALKRNNLEKNTLVICTTDHGIAFPAMKCTLNDHGIGVMLIMKGPGGFTGGKVFDSLISQIDIYPSICELLSIEPPEHLEGNSFMPIIRGDEEEVNSEIYAEVNYHCQYEPMRAIRTKRWKYIHRYIDQERPLLANVDSSHSKDLWLENGYKDHLLAREQLYDLIFDPNEANNLVNDCSKIEILKEMRRKLDIWMKDTNDPLLNGKIPLPQGAVVANPEDIEPQDIWGYTEKSEGYF